VRSLPRNQSALNLP